MTIGLVFALNPFVPQDIVLLVFAKYAVRQKAMDFTVSGGGCPVAMSPTQNALANLSRFGPRTAFWAMVLLGAVPSSGATSNFQVWQPGFILGYLGGHSAIGRAFARGDARTVAVLLFCAPNIVLSGTAWKQAHIHTRHDLIRWIAETLQHDPEIVEHAMLTQARRATITPVLEH